MSHALSYQKYVTEISKLYVEARGKGEAALAPLEPPVKFAASQAEGHTQSQKATQNSMNEQQMRILIISPHPDDECLMGSYALRLKEEFNAKIYVLPFTFGSNKERQAARKQELLAAVKVLGFELVERGKLKDSFSPYVLNELVTVMKTLDPHVIFSPHEEDGHPVHQKAYQQTRDALQILQNPSSLNQQTIQGTGEQQKKVWVQTEFWRDLKSPNLLVPLSSAHVIKIGEALQCHAGEVERNPYHLRLPAWYQDQVRKGSERVGGAGAPSVEAVFGQVFTQIVL